ncbi:unnamed protein product [Owenia fusiformis]|uniref:Uncharacterized protein n=1 Tax=Owenia fusiformis TaxID=6347 RepID=A0A8J1UBG9_OWEFU|nr:unnamed protein product [Owenia fusiformis]
MRNKRKCFLPLTVSILMLLFFTHAAHVQRVERSASQRENDKTTNPVDLERDGTIHKLDSGRDATIDELDPEIDQVDHGRGKTLDSADPEYDQVDPDHDVIINPFDPERKTTIEYETTVNPVDPQRQTTIIDSDDVERDVANDQVHPEFDTTIQSFDPERAVANYQVNPDREVTTNDSVDDERDVANDQVNSDREVTTNDSDDDERDVANDQVNFDREVTTNDSVDDERDVAIDQVDPEYDPTINPVDTQLETTIGSVGAERDVVIGQVDPEYETTITPVDPHRETTIVSVDLEHDIAIYKADPDRETTFASVGAKLDVTNDQVNPKYNSTINPVDPERDVTTNQVHPQRETTIDSVDPERKSIFHAFDVSVRPLDDETITNTIHTLKNLTISTEALEDLNSCGDDISRYTCMENTCRGRCGQMNNYTNALWLCSCDAACPVYGDCCKDFNDVCDNHTYNSEMEEVFVCKDIGPGQYIYMKQSCRPDYNDVDIIQKCYGESGVEGVVPVTDELTNVVYVNYFCALCNLVNDNLVPWKISMHCPLSGHFAPISGNDIIEMLSKVRRPRRCLISKIPLDKGLNVRRPCISILATQCRGCKDDGIIEACKTGVRDPQFSKKGGLIARNVYCLKCMGWIDDSHDCDIFLTPNGGNTISDFFAYSVLVDVINDSGSVLQIKADSGIAGIDSVVKVKGAEISMIQCPNRSKLVKNECVFSETQFKVFCKIPTRNKNAQNIEALVTEVIKEAFDILGFLYVAPKSDGSMHCHFFVSFQNETFDWETEFIHNEKIIQRSFPPVDSISTVRYCLVENDEIELSRANLVEGESTTEGHSVTSETSRSHSSSGNRRIMNAGNRLWSGLYVSTSLFFALTYRHVQRLI